MAKIINFLYSRSVWSSDNPINISLKNTNTKEYIIEVDEKDLKKIDMDVNYYKDNIPQTILRRFKSSPYEGDSDYASITEKIEQREKEIDELKLLRSILNKKPRIITK